LIASTSDFIHQDYTGFEADQNNSRRIIVKRVLAGILLSGMITAVAFAEIHVTGYAQGTITPYYTQDGDSTVTSGPSWGGIGPQIVLSAAGANPMGKAGYMFSVVTSLPGDYPGASPLNPGEENYIWLKPFGDFLALKAGGFNDYTLRGGSYFSDLFDAVNLNVWKTGGHAPDPGSWRLMNEQTLFSGYEARVNGSSTTNIRKPGALLTLTPMPNLYIGASFHLSGKFYDFENDKDATDYYTEGQYALGYTIENIGQIKAQYIGEDSGRNIAEYDEDTKLIQAAFKLTMLPVGPIEIGATIPLSYADSKPDGYAEPITVAAGTDLSFGKFGLKAFLAAGFGGATEEDVKTGVLVTAGLEPRYAITDALSVLVPVGMTFQGATTNMKDDASYLDVGAAVRLDLGATWNLNAGAVYATQISHGDGIEETKAKFAIPIYFSGALF
jgi:hypothetical protein